MPVDQNQIDKDVNDLPNWAKTMQPDCKKINRDIKSSGGVAKYYKKRVGEKRNKSKGYTRRRN